jgi:hypothetical protein
LRGELAHEHAHLLDPYRNAPGALLLMAGLATVAVVIAGGPSSVAWSIAPVAVPWLLGVAFVLAAASKRRQELAADRAPCRSQHTTMSVRCSSACSACGPTPAKRSHVTRWVATNPTHEHRLTHQLAGRSLLRLPAESSRYGRPSRL